MVFAMAFERNVAQQDHLVIAFGFLEGARQHVRWIFQIAREEFLIGAHDPVRRAHQTFAVRTSPAQRSSTRTAASASSRDGRFRSAAISDLAPAMGWMTFMRTS